MIIVFSQGRIIANQYEIVIRLDGVARVTLQASVDDLRLIGKGANVVTAVGSGINWSMKLDNEQQLQQLATDVGIAVDE